MKALKALPGVVFYIALFIVLPRLLIEKIPALVIAVFGAVNSVLTSLAVMGVVLAALYAAKTLAPKGSSTELAAHVLSEAASLGVLLFFIGFGSPLSLGKGERSIPIGPDSVIFFDFHIFALLFITVTTLRIAAKIFEYYSKHQTAG